MTKNTKYSILAMLSGFAVFGLLLGLGLAGVDWAGAGREWFQLVLWTGFVFGLVAYHRRRWLKKTRALMVFVALLAVHIVALVSYLRAAEGFPNVFFLIASPVEAALVAFVVGLVGGSIVRRKRPGKRSPHTNSPPDTTEEGSAEFMPFKPCGPRC
jgi:multisubunit Na+/H+ antiporter MnhG subunit